MSSTKTCSHERTACCNPTSQIVLQWFVRPSMLARTCHSGAMLDQANATSLPSKSHDHTLTSVLRLRPTQRHSHSLASKASQNDSNLIRPRQKRTMSAICLQDLPPSLILLAHLREHLPRDCPVVSTLNQRPREFCPGGELYGISHRGSGLWSEMVHGLLSKIRVEVVVEFDERLEGSEEVALLWRAVVSRLGEENTCVCRAIVKLPLLSIYSHSSPYQLAI